MEVRDEEWGPWIEHDGKGCPCVGKYTHIVLGGDAINDDGEWEDPSEIVIINNAESEGIARNGGSWNHDPEYYPIIRYRIRKPRALLEMIERARELSDNKLGELEEI